MIRRFARATVAAGAIVAGVYTFTANDANGPLVVHDLDGRAWAPLAPARGEVNLLFFVSAECPITQRYSPEIDRIAAAYAKRGVRTWLVFAEPSLSPADARRNLHDFHAGSAVPTVIDAGFALTAAAGATITPEAVIYTAAGRVYRGRIDDLYVSIGQSRRQATSHDLRDALDAMLAGRPVAHPETPAVGCYIERTVK